MVPAKKAVTDVEDQATPAGDDRDGGKKARKAAAAAAATGATTTTARREGVGDVLRAAREKKKLSQQDVAKAINLRLSQVKALEDNTLEGLPGLTYAIGFVRGYADHLGLDSAEMVRRFKAEHQEEITEKPELHYPVPIDEGHMPGTVVVAVSVFVAVILLVVWSTLSGSSREDVAAVAGIPPVAQAQEEKSVLSVITARVSTAPEAEQKPAMETKTDAVSEVESESVAIQPAPEVAAQPVAVQPAPEVPAQQDPVVRQEQPPAPAAAAVDEKPKKQPADGARIVIRARENSWVQIVDGNENVLLKKVLRPGDQFRVPDQKGIEMMTGNAGGLEVFVDGKQVQALGKSGDVLRGVELSPSDLAKPRRTAR